MMAGGSPQVSITNHTKGKAHYKSSNPPHCENCRGCRRLLPHLRAADFDRGCILPGMWGEAKNMIVDFRL